MKPTSFAYVRPESLTEATELLVDAGGNAKVLAGGQSLVPLLAFRLVRPSMLVDIGHIPGMDRLDVTGDVIRIGAMCTHRAVELHPRVRTTTPLIAAGLRRLGHVAIRNAGTVGGSLAHADPAAEWPALGLALDATVHVSGPSGTRAVPIDRFFRDWMQPDLAIGEILTQIEITIPRPDHGWGFEEAARRHGDFGLAGAAVVASTRDGVITDLRIGLLGAGLTPLRARSVEAALLGGRVDADHRDTVAATLEPEISPLDDQHATAAEKRHLAAVLTSRALRQALIRAGTPA